MNVYKKKLIVIAKNNAKKRMHNALTDHQTSLLSLGPKFVPAEKNTFCGNYYSNGISGIKLTIPQ